MKKIHTFLYIICCFLQLLLQVEAVQKVLLTGAGGRTGRLAFQKLLSYPQFDPTAVVRTEGSKKRLLKASPLANEQNVVVADVTDFSKCRSVFEGTDSVILCTSAVPRMTKLSLVKMMAMKLIGKSSLPSFYFPTDGDPYHVDWLGAKNQIDAAKENGIKQFVFLSSMGGTQPDHLLNDIGKIKNNEKSGNILKWKRKSEKYLIESGIPYTIIHAGGLIDEGVKEGQVLLGADDEFFYGNHRYISRNDVAETCIHSLVQKKAKNRSIDVVMEYNLDRKKVEMDWEKFFSNPKNCKYDDFLYTSFQF